MTDWYDANLVLLQYTAVNILLGLSLQVPLRMGVFSVAGVGFYGIGAYTSVVLTLRFGLPPLVCVAAGMLISVAAAAVLSVVLRRLDGIYLGMATIAFVQILVVVALNWDSVTGGALGLFGAVVDLPMPLVALVVVAALVLVAASERGRIGRRIEAVREDRALAASMGIGVRRTITLSYLASALLGGCAGGLSSLLSSTVSPAYLGFHLVVLALTMIIVGGSRSWVGALIGAVLVTWLPNLLSVATDLSTVVYGVVVAVAAVWMPGGIAGVVTELVRRRQAGRRAATGVVAVSAAAPDAEELAGIEVLQDDRPVGRPG